MKNDNGLSSSPTGAPDSAPTAVTGRTTLDWGRDTGTTGAVLQEMELQVRLLRRRRRRFLGAATALAVLLVGGWSWQQRSRSLVPGPAATSAIVSGPTRQQLPDGSTAWLRPGAEIAVDFSPSFRRIELKHGEAHFEVTKNPERPFVVRAAGVEVRAVGTAFSVNLKPAAVEVLVTHGEIAIEKPGAVTSAPTPAAAPIGSRASVSASETLARVMAGNRIEVVTAPQLAASDVIALSSAEIDDRLAWRIPKLHFSRTPLVEVVALFNQHSPARLVLGDDSLRPLKLSGVIRADNIDALLQLLASDYGIKAERRSGNEIVLQPK